MTCRQWGIHKPYMYHIEETNPGKSYKKHGMFFKPDFSNFSKPDFNNYLHFESDIVLTVFRKKPYLFGQ